MGNALMLLEKAGETKLQNPTKLKILTGNLTAAQNSSPRRRVRDLIRNIRRRYSRRAWLHW